MANFSTYFIAGLTLGCVCLGILIGGLLRGLLPKHHLSKSSQDLIKSAAGLMATLVALIIGLLVSSAKGTFDSANSGIAQVGAKAIALDRVLKRYGPETKESRDLLQKHVQVSIQRFASSESNASEDDAAIEAAAGIESIHDKIRDLKPKTDEQRQLQTQALQISEETLTALLQLLEQSQSDLPTFFVIVLIAWLAALFMSFGMLAPGHATAYGALLVCAVSISCAVFLILELNRPLQGAIQVSIVPLQKAASMMRKSL